MPDASRPITTRQPARLRAKLMLAAAAVMVTIGVVEGALWCFHPMDGVAPKRFHKYLPSWSAIAPVPRTLLFDPGPLSGVTPGVSSLEFNRYGFLYPVTKFKRSSAEEIRIAVVGGSTAECSALVAEKRWSAVLEGILTKAVPGRPITVLNLGVSAQDTRTHLATMCQHITDLDVNLVIFMLGANDLFRVGGGYDPMATSDCFYKTNSASRSLKHLFRLTQIGRHIHNRKKFADSGPAKPYFHKQAKHQASLPLVDKPVEIGADALAGYSRNIISLYGLCAAHEIAALFTTQPMMLTPEPTEAERAVLWGFHTGARRVSAGNFIALLGSINRCLVDTCEEHQDQDVVNLAKVIPKGLGYFYDQVHFNERGAQLVAEKLAPRTMQLLELSR